MSSKMSHDRVKFFISARRVDGNRRAFGELLSYAFDMDCNNYQFDAARRPYRVYGFDAEGVVIVCRPSQFARFLIKRNELDLNNGFKELHPVLFVPDQDKSPLDVSKRTHKDPSMGHGSGTHDEDHF